MAWTTAVEPKPLSPSVKKGLDWLVDHQLPGGGWGEGDLVRERFAGSKDELFRETPNVADTCIASLALIRSGSTPREGPYRGAIVKGVQYVRSQVEVSDARSLAISSQSSTRAQGKLGPNIDTYLASMLLAEVKGRMPDEASERAVDLALDKVIGKIERHLAEDGPFEFEGWAPVLALAMSAKGLNRARQAGARVSDVALARVGDAARMAYTHGGWPVAYEVAGRTGHAHTGHQASRRPRATDGVGSAAKGSSRSMATVVDDEEAGHESMLSAASPAPPPSAAGRAARDGESAGRRSLLGGASPVPPSPSVRDGEDAGRRGLLAGAGPLPSSSAAAGEAKDGEDGDLRTEPSAGSPASQSHRARRRMTISWEAVPPPAVGRTTKRGMAAGVPLYGWSACLGILQDSFNTGRAQVPRLRDQAAHSRHPQERAEAKKKLARIAEVEQFQQEAQATVVARLDDRIFLGGVSVGVVVGVGGGGGEEFLSYMNLAESLAVMGDEAWRRWDSGMTENLNRAQNADGSWTGSHCITGRTFCTAAVLLTLMADRTPVPVPARATTSSSSR